MRKADSSEIANFPEQMLFGRLCALQSPQRHTLWLHQPYNLYLIDRQAEAYIDLMGYQAYVGAFHNAIRNLISDHRLEILAGLGSPIELLDLGPGYPDKTFPLLQELRARGAACRYVPVDISRRFLAIASAACRSFEFPIEPRHCLFEELPRALNGFRHAAAGSSRLVMLGVTFMNYVPSLILSLIAKLLRGDDALIVAAELFEEDRLASILAPYSTKKAEDFNFLILELLGFPRHAASYFARFNRRRVEMGFRVLETVRLKEEFVLAAGQEIVTSISYRHTLEQLRAALESRFRAVEIFTGPGCGSAVAKVSRAIPAGSRGKEVVS